MPSVRLWPVAGVLAGLAGLATSYAAAMVLMLREPPVVAVAQGIITLLPGPLVEKAIEVLGAADKAVLLGVVLLGFAALSALAGRLARGAGWRQLLVWLPLAGIGVLAVVAGGESGVLDLVPVAVGLLTWLAVLPLLAGRLSLAVVTDSADTTGRTGEARHHRRVFLTMAGVIAGLSVGAGALGAMVGRGRQHVEEARRLLRIPGVSRPTIPDDAMVGLAGVSPWLTPAREFYLVHTAISLPVIEPAHWQLRIHGMVERELTVSLADLMERRRTEAWITLSCVSNEVGGELVGNAWWSGVALEELLAEVGVSPEADCVLQTSEDGWNCSTPLAAMTDPERPAMLALAMNGRPLPVEHGFPVRTIVPGLFGYVSATKWVVDMEITRFEDVSAFWTSRGWSEMGPVKLTSRIDVPRPGAEVPAGRVAVGGVAWEQHTGIRGVEVALDGGAWQSAELAGAPSTDTWVQWRTDLDCPPGDHVLRVRATNNDGEVQTGVARGVLPDGATGWHQVEFTAGV